ncbi:MAG: hypothetical protein Q8M00_00980 [bacterium]|nr:hypothetical protein [bacterium]
MKPKYLNKLYWNFVKKHDEKISFIVLVYFLITFIIFRGLAYAWAHDIIPEVPIYIDGIRIHHYNFGIFILVFVGYWLLVRRGDGNLFNIAKIYGIGLAMVFDQFGMWLQLQDNYWLRPSYDGAIIIIVGLLNIVYLGFIWQKIIEKNIALGKKIWKNLFKR